jgi:AcrR family transcriptional regulator
MGARAQAAAQTARDILDATVGLYSQRFFDQVSLEDIAERAGVTVQTVLRRFVSKDRLLEEAMEWASRDLERRRSEVPAGDVDAAVRRAVDDYEEWGDAVLRLLAQEDRVPAMRRLTDRGRELHYEWVDRVFGLQLAARRGAARGRLRAQLIAVTDVYTWKLFRRDLGLGRRETERALLELIASACPQANDATGKS